MIHRNKVPLGTPDAVMAQTGMEKKKKLHNYLKTITKNYWYNKFDIKYDILFHVRYILMHSTYNSLREK
jgi:hypothetical protein